MFCDLTIRETLGDELEDVSFLRRQPGETLVLLRSFAEAFEHRRGHRRSEQLLTLRDEPHCLNDVVALDLLQDVTGRARHDRVEQGLIVGKRSEHEATDLRMPRTDLTADLDPVTVGQPNVEQRYIWSCWRDS